MTWQRMPYVPGCAAYLTEWSIRLERNHKKANILVVHLGSWIYMRSFRKRKAP
jgi:hypothetical protein